MKLFKTLGGTVNSIEDMVIDIHNHYTDMIKEKDKEIANLKAELNKISKEWSDEFVQNGKKDNTIEKLKKELDLSIKANKVLEDRIKELKTNETTKKSIMDYLKECTELLKNSNEIAKENHKLKKPNKKDVKLSIMGKVSDDTKEKLK